MYTPPPCDIDNVFETLLVFLNSSNDEVERFDSIHFLMLMMN